MKVEHESARSELESLIAEIVRVSDARDLGELPRLVDSDLFKKVVADLLGCEVASFYVFDETEGQLRFLHEAVKPALNMPFFTIKGRNDNGFIAKPLPRDKFEEMREHQSETLVAGDEPLTASLCYDILLTGKRCSTREKEDGWILIPEGEIVTFCFEYYLLMAMKDLPKSRLGRLEKLGLSELRHAVAEMSLGADAWQAVSSSRERLRGRDVEGLRKMAEWLLAVVADGELPPSEREFAYLWQSAGPDQPMNWFVNGWEDLRELLTSTSVSLEDEGIFADFAALIIWHGFRDHAKEHLDLTPERFYKLSRLSPRMETLLGTRNIVGFLVESQFLTDLPRQQKPIKAFLIGTFYNLEACMAYSREIKMLYRLLSHRDHTRYVMLQYRLIVQHLKKTQEIMATLSGSAFVHELRRPLVTIRMAAKILDKKKHDREFPAHLERSLKRINSSVDRVMRMIVVFRSIASANRPLDRKAVDLTDLVKSVVKGIRPGEEQDLLLDAGEKLPSSITLSEEYPGHKVWALVNDVSVELVVRNLIRNAAEAMNNRGPIRITLTTIRETAELAVEDNGPGIANSITDVLFDIFTTTKEQKHGMGLGLYMCQQLLLMQDADIRYDDTYRNGARFVVTFKRHQHYH